MTLVKRFKKNSGLMLFLLMLSPLGLSELNMQPRIIGGYTAPDNWLFMAVLIQRDPISFEHYLTCGGSLVSSEHIMTAAHCVDNFLDPQLMQNLFVIIGDNSPFGAGWENQKIGITNIEIHPNYSGFDNDIAILTLASLQPSDNSITAASNEALPSSANPLPYSVLGWGDTDARDACTNFPLELQKVELNIVVREECEESYGANLTQNMICATAPYTSTVNKDACQGDSGGPLIEKLGDGSYQQVGIVSWGMSCGDPQNPGVYTNVAKYDNWISSFTSVAQAVSAKSMATSGIERGPLAEGSCRGASKSGGSLDLLLLFLLLPLAGYLRLKR